jgi:hypothetical protein
MDLIVASTVGALPTIASLEMLPTLPMLCDLAFRIHQKQRDHVAFPQRDLELGQRLIAAATEHDSRHRTSQHLLQECSKTLSRWCLLTSRAPSALDVQVHFHQRFPPILPFDQSCPNEYSSNQGLRRSSSSRCRRVEPFSFSQTRTHSGDLLKQSTSTSE